MSEPSNAVLASQSKRTFGPTSPPSPASPWKPTGPWWINKKLHKPLVIHSCITENNLFSERLRTNVTLTFCVAKVYHYFLQLELTILSISIFWSQDNSIFHFTTFKIQTSGCVVSPLINSHTKISLCLQHFPVFFFFF